MHHGHMIIEKERKFFIKKIKKNNIKIKRSIILDQVGHTIKIKDQFIIDVLENQKLKKNVNIIFVETPDILLTNTQINIKIKRMQLNL